MRHFRSILYAWVLAPAVWVLVGVGLTHDLTARGRDGFAIESATGLVLLLLGGAAYGILVFAPISPAGPTLAGMVFLGAGIWAIEAPAGYAAAWPPDVAKAGFDLSRPGYGLAVLLSVPMILTALSARRWARYEPPVLPVIGRIGRVRGSAAAPGTPIAVIETAVLPDNSERRMPAARPTVDEADTTVVVASPEPTAVVADTEPTAVVADQKQAPVAADQKPAPVAAAREPTPVAIDEEPTAVVADQESTAVANDEEPTAVVIDEEPTVAVVKGVTVEARGADDEGEATATGAQESSAGQPGSSFGNGEATVVITGALAAAAEPEAIRDAGMEEPTVPVSGAAGERTQIIPLRGPGTGGDRTQVIRAPSRPLDGERTQVIRPGLPVPTGERTEVIRLPSHTAEPAVSIAGAEAPAFGDDPTSRIVPPAAQPDEASRTMTVMNVERPPDDIPAQRRPSSAED